MSYQKQNFEKGQILTAEHLNNIEDGLAQIEQSFEDAKNSGQFDGQDGDMQDVFDELGVIEVANYFDPNRPKQTADTTETNPLLIDYAVATRATAPNYVYAYNDTNMQVIPCNSGETCGQYIRNEITLAKAASNKVIVFFSDAIENATSVEEINSAVVGTGTTHIFTVPDNATYMGICYTTSYQSRMEVVKGTETVNGAAKYNGGNASYIIKSRSTSLNDKRVFFFGDSITAATNGLGWVDEFISLASLSKQDSTVNVAVGGASWSDRPGTVLNGTTTGDNNTISNQVQKVINGYNNGEEKYTNAPDIIIMSAGSNDQAPTESEIDALEETYVSGGAYIDIDTIDRKKMAGGIRWAVEKLHSLYPNAKFILLTPIQSAEGKRLYTECVLRGKMVMASAKRLGIAYIDCIHCGIYGGYEIANAEGQYLYDGTHPNEKGAKLLGKFIYRNVNESEV